MTTKIDDIVREAARQATDAHIRYGIIMRGPDKDYSDIIRSAIERAVAAKNTEIIHLKRNSPYLHGADCKKVSWMESGSTIAAYFNDAYNCSCGVGEPEDD